MNFWPSLALGTWLQLMPYTTGHALTTLYNKARSLENNADGKQHAEKTINDIILAKLVTYIEDKRNQGNDVPVINLKHLTTCTYPDFNNLVMVKLPFIQLD